MKLTRPELWQAFWDGWNSREDSFNYYQTPELTAMWYTGRNLKRVATNDIERFISND